MRVYDYREVWGEKEGQFCPRWIVAESKNNLIDSAHFATRAAAQGFLRFLRSMGIEKLSELRDR